MIRSAEGSPLGKSGRRDDRDGAARAARQNTQTPLALRNRRERIRTPAALDGSCIVEIRG